MRRWRSSRFGREVACGSVARVRSGLGGGTAAVAVPTNRDTLTGALPGGQNREAPRGPPWQEKATGNVSGGSATGNQLWLDEAIGSGQREAAPARLQVEDDDLERERGSHHILRLSLERRRLAKVGDGDQENADDGDDDNPEPRARGKHPSLERVETNNAASFHSRVSRKVRLGPDASLIDRSATPPRPPGAPRRRTASPGSGRRRRRARPAPRDPRPRS